MDIIIFIQWICVITELMSTQQSIAEKEFLLIPNMIKRFQNV